MKERTKLIILAVLILGLASAAWAGWRHYQKIKANSDRWLQHEEGRQIEEQTGTKVAEIVEVEVLTEEGSAAIAENEVLRHERAELEKVTRAQVSTIARLRSEIGVAREEAARAREPVVVTRTVEVDCGDEAGPVTVPVDVECPECVCLLAPEERYVFISKIIDWETRRRNLAVVGESRLCRVDSELAPIGDLEFCPNGTTEIAMGTYSSKTGKVRTAAKSVPARRRFALGVEALAGSEWRALGLDLRFSRKRAVPAIGIVGMDVDRQTVNAYQGYTLNYEYGQWCPSDLRSCNVEVQATPITTGGQSLGLKLRWEF